MTESKNYTLGRQKSAGDVAVDGLLAGLLAGALMAALLVLAEFFAGTGVTETLGRFDPSGSGAPMAGVLFHLAVSGIYGVVFALVFRFLARRRPRLLRHGWLIGGAYGVLLWAAARFVFVSSFNNSLAETAALLFLLAHILFGLVLGLLLTRMERGATDTG